MKNGVILVHFEMVLFPLAVGMILGLLRTLVLFVFEMRPCAAAELCVRICRLSHSCGIVWCSPGEVELSYEEGRSKFGEAVVPSGSFSRDGADAEHRGCRSSVSCATGRDNQREPGR